MYFSKKIYSIFCYVVSSVPLAHYRSYKYNCLITKSRSNSIRKKLITNILSYISEHTKTVATKLETRKTPVLSCLGGGKDFSQLSSHLPHSKLAPSIHSFQTFLRAITEAKAKTDTSSRPKL